MKNEYVITDGRPLPGATIMCFAETLQEAQEDRPCFGEDAQIWLTPNLESDEFIDHTRWVLQPNAGKP